MSAGERRDGEPTFSVVVPVHNVSDYLAECLDSVLGQTGPPFEVIGIDDASTDDSGAILDRCAAGDERLHVEHLPANVGLGRARNAGLALARGEYVLFVDSDDALAPGTLAALDARIEQAGRPDVVIFGFARRFGDGAPERDPRSAALAPEAVLPARERPQLLEIFPAAWNKAYRRAFLAEHGFEFPPGYYEDIPFTYPVLMTARSVATLDRVCYLYRQRGGGTILRSPGRRHLDVFAQWARTFTYLDAHPELESWRPLLVDRASRHLPGLLDQTERIPAALRREFYHQAASTLRRVTPKGYRPDVAAPLRVKLKLIDIDFYPAFRTAQVGKAWWRRLRAPGRA